MSIGAGRKGICELFGANSIATAKSPCDGGNDGTLFDQWRYILDAAALDWVGCCDHDNGGGREYSWWITQKLTDVFYAPGKFAPMFSYERSVQLSGWPPQCDLRAARHPPPSALGSVVAGNGRRRKPL